MKFAYRKAIWAVALLGAATMTAAVLDTKLADAVQNGDIATVRALLKQHVDVNAPQADGMTPLLWASHNDDTAAADLLLKAGANVKLANRYGILPISEAATNGSAQMLELLIKAGADPNTALPEGDTPLMLASRTGNAAAVKVLLDHHADPNTKEGWHGETALMWAAGENHPDVVKMLAAAGADVNAQATHLQYANMKKVDAGVFSSYPAGGLTALIEAVRENAYDSAAALLDAGANPNQKDASEMTPLIVAITNAHWDMANLLLDKGADPNDGSMFQIVEVRNADQVVRAATNRPDKTTLIDVLNSLLAHGANPDSKLAKSFPAHKALGGAPGAPLDATGFYRAAKASDLEVMNILLAKGANPNIVLKDGSTPLMAAAGIGHRGGAGGAPKEAPDADIITAVRMCLYYGDDINAADATGMTALHAAAQLGNNTTVQYLVAHGAKMDLKDKRNRTPLDIANGAAGGTQPGQRSDPHPATAALLRKLQGLPEIDPNTIAAKPIADKAPVDPPLAGPGKSE